MTVQCPTVKEAAQIYEGLDGGGGGAGGSRIL